MAGDPQTRSQFAKYPLSSIPSTANGLRYHESLLLSSSLGALNPLSSPAPVLSANPEWPPSFNGRTTPRRPHTTKGPTSRPSSVDPAPQRKIRGETSNTAPGTPRKKGLVEKERSERIGEERHPFCALVNLRCPPSILNPYSPASPSVQTGRHQRPSPPPNIHTRLLYPLAHYPLANPRVFPRERPTLQPQEIPVHPLCRSARIPADYVPRDQLGSAVCENKLAGYEPVCVD